MGPIDMVVLRIEKSFQDMVILILLGIRMRGCVTLGLNGIEMSMYGLLALGLVRDMRVGVCLVEMVPMRVVRVVSL